MRLACLIAGGLVCAAGMACGQTVPGAASGAGFDCWVGYDGKPDYTHYIRCIADRDIPSPPAPDSRSEAFLELLHQELHRGGGSSAEKIFKSNIEVVRESRAVWNIRIYSYPTEWSWKEGMPERLVRAVLCPRETTCSVLIREH